MSDDSQRMLQRSPSQQRFHSGGPHLPVRPRPREMAPANTPAEKPAMHSIDQGQSGLGGQCQLAAVDLKKSFRKGEVDIPVLRGVDLEVRPGELLSVVGQSGSGKSTLLHLLCTLDSPDEGEVHFGGRRIDNLPTAARDTLRNRNFGMIFQFYHLLPELTALENVLVPLMIGSSAWQFFRGRREYRGKAARLLEMVGLGHRLRHKPRELSGGEMQRAAIARALLPGPDVLFADEPTGNLDHATGREILRVLRSLNAQQNLTIVMVTHDRAIAEEADRTVCLADGRIEDL